MTGDLLCATGLPITAYLSVMGAAPLFGYQLVGAGEGPGAGNTEDIGVACDIGWKRCKGCRELDDMERGLVQNFPSRRTVDFDFFERTVGFDRNGHDQTAIRL